MKPTRSLLSFLFGSVFLTAQMTQAATYIWDNTNVTGTPPATLDWFTGGSNPLGLWTGPVVPVSDPTTIIKFFADTTTNLPNTNTTLATQTVNLNNGGSAFQLGALELNGFGSTTSGASLTMTLQGDALNFSGATGTISFNSKKNTAPATDPVINYTINNNIQLGTAGSASELTLNGNGDGSSPSTTTYNIGGNISELQTGGGSIIKSGSSSVNISGAINITGAVTVSAGTLNLTSSTNTASSFTVNGGTLILTGNLTPASASMTVNSTGILRIGNNTATQFGPSGVYSGNISTGTGGTLQLWSSSNQEFSGIISGSGGIWKAYGGALTLSGANTYSGKSQFLPETTTGFTVNVSSFDYVASGTWANHGLGSSLGAPTTVANGTIDVGSTGKQAGVNLTYVSTATGETTDRVINLGFNGTSSQTITANNSTGVLRFTSAFTANTGTSGKLILGGTGAGQIDLGLPQLATGGLEKTGTGTWTLGGSGNFTGPTTITAGILNLSSATALQNSPFSTASTAGTGSIGLKTSVTTLTLGGLTGSNALRGRFTTALGGPSSVTTQGGYDGLTNLTLNTVAGSTSTYTGAIVEGATGMSLTKTGAGIQTLNAAHGYTGTTSVNGGFLQLNGSSLTGGLSVSNATFASNSSFAGVSTIGSGGIVSPGASSGAIGTLTLSNATASALTLNGSIGIFDLPATVTTPDQIAVTGGLVVSGANTVLLRTPTTGVLEGVYTLMTAGSNSGAGSFVLANGSATRGNATVSMSGSNVILTVAAGGLAGTTTYTGTSGAYNSERWFVTGNWNSGAVPTGTTNVVLSDQTAAFTIPAFNTSMPTYSGDLWIGNNVTLQVGSTTANAAFNNAYGTPGSTIIYMGANSAISHRNSGNNPTMPAIVLLGDASMRFQESTQGKADPNFANSISGNFTLTLNSGNGNGFSTHTLNAANSFAGLNLAGTAGVVNAAVSGSIGTANLTISGGGTVNLNHATAMSDGSNPIRINSGILAYGTTPTAALALSTRPIELNGSGGATINNANTASSSAYTLTLGGGISSTAAGAKTLTLGGANVGNNTISGNITNPSGTIALTKADAGMWVLSGSGNSYTGATSITGGVLRIKNASSLGTTAGGVTQSGTSALEIDGSGGAVIVGAEALGINGGGISNQGALRNIAGDNTYGGTITLAAQSRINSDSGMLLLNNATAVTGGVHGLVVGGAGNVTISGAITTTTGSAGNSLLKDGAGTLILSGPNTYSGTTQVNAGNLVAAANAPSGLDGAFGNATTDIALGVAGGNAAAGVLTSGAYTIGRIIRNATSNDTDAGTRVLTLGGNSAHASVFSGNIFLGTSGQTSKGIQLTAAANGQATFSGVIQETGGTRTAGEISSATALNSVTKAGGGTVILTNANTYLGKTVVSEGALLVNNTTGSGTGTNTVTVNSGGTLGGTGTIGGAVNVSGQLSPGASIETLGTGALALLNGSTLVHELDSSVATSAGSDLLKVTGNLDLGATVGLTLDDLAATDMAFVDTNVFSLINYTGTWNNGMFTFSGEELSDEEVFTFGLNTWKISYNDADGGLNYSGEFAGGSDSFVNLTVVSTIPEPGAVFLGSMGLLLILRRRR